jgi:hypothetical protein
LHDFHALFAGKEYPMSIAIKVGDFVVARGQWRLDCVQATKVTKQTVFFIDESWGKPRERRIDFRAVLFAGPENVTKRLYQQLQSSYQQKISDQQQASVRQEKRDAEFIASAVRDCPQESE